MKLRSSGMPLPEIRRYAQMVMAGPGNESERFDILRQHEAKINSRSPTCRRPWRSFTGRSSSTSGGSVKAPPISCGVTGPNANRGPLQGRARERVRITAPIRLAK